MTLLDLTLDMQTPLDPFYASLPYLGLAVRVGEGAVLVLAPVHPGTVLAECELLNLIKHMLIAGGSILQEMQGIVEREVLT